MSFKQRYHDYPNLDRHDLNRYDPDWIQSCLNHANARVIASYQSRYPVTEQKYVTLLTKFETEAFSAEPLDYYFLGELDSGEWLFTTEIKEPLNDLSHWLSIRHIPVDDPLTNALLYTQGLLNWFNSSRYCHVCSSALRIHHSGNKQVCHNSDCGIEIFPRINPAIIVLLLHEDACLLAHAHHFKGDIPMYSCVAGYMETGEDFEQTLRREVYEEVGLDVDKINYRGNQSWPFPNSLMIGFHAETTNTDFTFHDGEIKSAQWFTRQDIINAVKASDIRLPTPKSISYTLIADWFNDNNDMTLEALLASR